MGLIGPIGNLQKRQRFILSALLFCFVFVFVVGITFAPRAVYAVPSEVTADAPAAVKEVKLTIWQQIWSSALIGLVNSVTLFAQTVAYDMAVGLASGCRGEQACAFVKDPGTYFTAVSYSALGEFLGNLTGPWEELGFNLCNPRLPSVGLAITLGLAEKFQRPKPKCDFLATLNNWDNFVQETTDPHKLLKHAALNFEPGASDIGQAFKAQEQFRLQVARKQRAELTKRLEGGGILPQSGIISGNVTTPAAVMRSNYDNLAKKGQGQSEPPSAAELASAVGGGDVWAAVGTTVLSTFVNTLASRLLKSFLAGLFGETPNTLPNLAEQFAGGGAGAAGTGELPGPPGLSSVASALLTPQIRTSTGSFDYVTELGTCDQNERNRTQLNCAIDQKFMVALQQAQAGRPLTVAAALEQGFLERGKPFGFVSPGNDPPVEPNAGRGEGYPYSGLKKLRLLRVIPLGWEFAALRIDQTDQPATLGDVVDGYAREGTPGSGCQGTPGEIANNESPFCGLVDPNWVLKAPQATCNALVFSANLDGSGTGRQEECVDWRHCVSEGGPGTDCRAWGYCTREKNTWRFDADSCDKQYASCDTFKPKEGEQLNLLENTVDAGTCNADNAGCTAFASRQNFAAQNLGGQATWDSFSARLYLDRDAPKCEARYDGCTELLPASDAGNVPQRVTDREADVSYPFSVADKAVYYKLPPDYLGCTGESTDRTECGSYSRICRREEVGCELYTPKIGRDSAIPGIATALDRCDPQCVGYDTYLKQSSRFEPVFDGEDLYPLIPNGVACPATSVGCEEFTNLRTEARQYFADLRACQVPGADSTTYFTWEGSDTTGYQLRTWSFKTSTQTYSADDTAAGVDYNTGPARPPCTNYAVRLETGTTVVDCKDEPAGGDTVADTFPQAVCNPTVLCDQNSASFDAARCADCRTFYDGDGNKFNRFMSRTIVSTPECQSFRWTGLPRLPEVAPASGDTPDVLRGRLEEAACNASHGFWYGEVKQCLYLGAPSLSSSCSQAHYGCRGFKGNTGSNMANVFPVEQFASSSSSLADRGWHPHPGATSTAITFSSESIFPGDQSLKVEGAGEGVRRELTEAERGTAQSAAGTTYFVAFNVKGSAGRGLVVALSNATATMASADVREITASPVSLTPDWKYVEVGPLVPEFVPTRVIFRNPSGAAMTFYLDEVRLRQSRDTVAMVKYSWNVPGVCDTLPAEAGGGYSRGAMLGCREYTDRAGGAHQLKSFSSLCRKDSAGCQDLVDTFGSDSPYLENFNTTNSGICRGEGGDPPRGCRVDTNGDGVIIYPQETPPEPNADDVVCTIGAGQSTCTYREVTSIYSGDIGIDNVTVPADRHRYVVVDPRNVCPKEQKGCQKLAPLDGNTPGTVAYRKNDPNTYNATTLCTNEARGCETWTRSDNSVAYFKQPASGSRCTWKTNIDIGTGTYSGWFRASKQPVDNQDLVNSKEECEGYGTWNFVTQRCTTLPAPGALGGTTLDPATGCGGVACDVNICTKGAYGKWNTTAGVCEAEAPCYGSVVAENVGGRPQIRVNLTESFLIGGTTFGIWRNADSLYGGLAGDCPKDQATCTAFLDPTDTSEGPDGRASDGRAYYLKDNARLTPARSACNGQVSRAQGCVLLANSEDPGRPWSAPQSYLASDLQRGALHPPVLGTPDAPGDANTILKVTRDRECAEWFQCASARFVNDPSTGRLKTICDILGRCNESAATPEEGGTIATCGSWVRQPLLDRSPQVDAQACSAAGFTWDAVGNSCTIPAANCTALGGLPGAGGQCELGDLTVETYLLRDRTFGGQEYTGYSVPELYGVDELREVDIGSGGSCDADSDCPFSYEICKDSKCTAPRLGHLIAGPGCDPGSGNAGCDGTPYCTADGQCVVAPTGGDFTATPTDNQSCRGFPERTSPFPNTELIRGSSEFEQVARCARRDGSCISPTNDCGYLKADFGGTQLYYTPATATTSLAAAICVGVNLDETHGSWSGVPKTCGAGGQITSAACVDAGGNCQALTRSTKVLGWPGYCLETDSSPWRILNADSTQHPCLTWLPIDQLPSARDIYDTHPEAGYQIQGPGGHYYCLQGGVAGVISLATMWQVASDNILWIDTVPVTEGVVYKYDIKEIQIQISLTGPSGGPPDGTYVFRPGDYSSDRLITANDVSLSRASGTIVEGWLAYDFRLPGSQAANEWWWWGGDDGDDRLNSTVITGNLMLAGPTIGGVGFLDTSSTPENHGVDNPSWRTTCDLRDETDENYDATFVGFHFNADHQLDYIRYGSCSNNDTTLVSRFDVTIYLHPHCEAIAAIDTTDPAARGSAPDTQKLWSGCTAAGATGCNLFQDGSAVWYRGDNPYSKHVEPWGSSDSILDPTGNHRWFLNHNGMEVEGATGGLAAPFAGWPWACEAGATGCRVQASAIGVNDTPSTGANRTIQDGLGWFKFLFAKSSALFKWTITDTDTDTDRYIETLSGAGTWDNRGPASGTSPPTVPRFRAVIGAAESNNAVETMTINDQYASGAQVTGVNGFLLTNLQYFVHADDRQMPLRRIRIDWDDEIIIGPADGLYKNARADCNNLGFGTSSGACQDEPYKAAHVYSCAGPEDLYWCPGPGCRSPSGTCPNADFQALYRGCCVFKPKVQATDNWEYCNGTCPGGAAGDRCLDTECTTHPGAWSEFAGEVLVAP